MALAAAPQATPVSSMDPLVRRIKEGSHAWVKLTLGERIALLEELREGYRAIAEQSVRAACEAKGIDPESPARRRGVAGRADGRAAQPAPPGRGAARTSSATACPSDPGLVAAHAARRAARARGCTRPTGWTRCCCAARGRGVHPAGRHRGQPPRAPGVLLPQAARGPRCAWCWARATSTPSRPPTASTRCSSRARSASSR